MTTWYLSVAIWTMSGAVGLTLALVGLRRAWEDHCAVVTSGQNGLLLHLSRAAVRSWMVRAWVQSTMVAFGLLAASIPAPVLPPDASAGAILRLLALRWSLSIASSLLVVASVADLWGRRRAGEIAGRKGGIT